MKVIKKQKNLDKCYCVSFTYDFQKDEAEMTCEEEEFDDDIEFNEIDDDSDMENEDDIYDLPEQTYYYYTKDKNNLDEIEELFIKHVHKKIDEFVKTVDESMKKYKTYLSKTPEYRSKKLERICANDI